MCYDSLSNRKQRVILNGTLCSWKDIEYGVPQGSFLGPLLFNIYLCALFYLLDDLDIESYADDTTLYTVKENKESVNYALETSSQNLFKWLNNKFVKANSDKYSLLLICNEPSTLLIDDSLTKTLKQLIKI